MLFFLFWFIDLPVKHENLAKKAILKSLWGSASETFSFLTGVISVANKSLV